MAEPVLMTERRLAGTKHLICFPNNFTKEKQIFCIPGSSFFVPLDINSLKPFFLIKRNNGVHCCFECCIRNRRERFSRMCCFKYGFGDWRFLRPSLKFLQKFNASIPYILFFSFCGWILGCDFVDKTKLLKNCRQTDTWTDLKKEKHIKCSDTDFWCNEIIEKYKM